MRHRDPHLARRQAVARTSSMHALLRIQLTRGDQWCVHAVAADVHGMTAGMTLTTNSLRPNARKGGVLAAEDCMQGYQDYCPTHHPSLPNASAPPVAGMILESTRNYLSCTQQGGMSAPRCLI